MYRLTSPNGAWMSDLSADGTNPFFRNGHPGSSLAEGTESIDEVTKIMVTLTPTVDDIEFTQEPYDESGYTICEYTGQLLQ